MAAITITALTPADANTRVKNVLAGAAISIGESVYKNTTNNDYELAQCDGTEEEAKAEGIAITGCADTERFYIAVGGRWKVTLSSGTLTAGEKYVLDGAGVAGALSPIGDLGSSDYTTVVFKAETTEIMEMDIDYGAERA